MSQNRSRNRTLRALPFIAVCIVLIGAIAVAGPASASAHKKKKPAPARLLVYAQEWSMFPSRPSIPAGTVIVQLDNRGQDQHDLRIRRLGSSGNMTGPVLGKVKVTNPGAVSQATWHLKKPGKYELYCSLPGHLAMGMHAKLTVKKASK